MPKVSVLTPLYNTDPAMLREAIDSILGQTFTDFEFILLNDSPENVELDKIVESYDDPRIVYIKNEKNLGISASRNKLLKLAQGEYLAIFDHDDISLSTRLEKQVNYLDSHPDVGVCSSWVESFPKRRIIRYPEDSVDIKNALLSHCAIIHSASMIRKSVLTENAIQWEERYSPCEDYMLWVRLMGLTMFHNIPEVLIRYRYFEGNTTNKQKEKMADKGRLVQCIAHKDYSFLLRENQKRKWIYFLRVIPLLKIKTTGAYKEYLLFGAIPLFTLK